MIESPDIVTRSRVLVTGGAGFIGSAVTEALLAAGHAVRVVDTMPGPRQRLTSPRLGGAELVATELAAAPLRELLVGIDAIIHLAGMPGVQPSWGGGFDDYVRHNTLATQRLLEAAGARRVVIASSSSVYGEVPHGTAREDAPLRPLSPYGVSKAAVEMLAHAYACRGVDAVVLRYFSVYGRYQRPDMAVARILDAVATGRPFPLRGDGSQCRDMTHVDDVVRATVASMTAPLEPGAIINVGGGRPVPLHDVIGEVQRQVGAPVPVVRTPAAPGDPSRTAADIARAAELLDWAPRVGLAHGIGEQIQHHEVLGSTWPAVAETVA